mgnify:FL=1
MGLFKDLVEFGTKWKLVDKHGWGAGLLYEDEVNKRRQEENDREYSNKLKEHKKGFYKIGNDIIKNNQFITQEEKNEVYDILTKIEKTSSTDLIMLLNDELRSTGEKIILNNAIRNILNQITNLLINNEKVKDEVKQTHLDYLDKVEKATDYNRKRMLLIELFDYLDSNKIRIPNRDEIISNLDMVNEDIEKNK